MKKQLGVSLSGFMMVLVVLAIFAFFGFKVLGPYKQFYTIQKVFKTVSLLPEVKAGGRREFINAWAKYSMTEGDVNVVSGDEVELTKDGNELIISTSYSVRVPLFKNVNLLIDFAPTSAAK